MANLNVIVQDGAAISVDVGENTVAAAASAAAAQIAATIAQAITGPLYANTTLGLGATVDGEGFDVDNADGTVTVYLNDGGTAVEIRTIIIDPSAPGASGELGHIASGTGAVTRTVQAKLRDTVSPEDFGAVGDGVADDTAAFVAARNAGAAIVAAPGKVYLLNEWSPGLATNVDFRGARVRRKQGANCAINFSNTYGRLANARFDQNIYDANGLVKTDECAVSTIVSGGAGATEIQVDDASPFRVGMAVFFETAGNLALSNVPGTPREEAGIVASITGDVITLTIPRYASVTVGGRIIGDYPLLRLGVGTFQPVLENLIFQRFVVGMLTSGEPGVSAGNAAPILVNPRFADFAGAAIVQRESFGVEIMAQPLVEGSHTVRRTHTATAGQTVFAYAWNVSPRCHRVGNITVTRNGVAVASGDFTINDVAGMITLATGATAGDTIVISNSEYAPRGILHKGAGGTVNSMGRMSNGAILACSVGIEVYGMSSGMQFMYGAAMTIDTCSFACMTIRGATGLNITGWSLLFAPYPLIFYADCANITFSPLWTSITDNGSIFNPSAYPHRFHISTTTGNNVNVPRQTWIAAGGQTVNVPARVNSDATILGTPHSGNLTIASGAITVTGSFHRVQNEAAAATDDLDTINGLAIDGTRLILLSNDSTQDVTVKNNTGNIRLAGDDFLLSTIADTIELMYSSVLSQWLEVGRSNNA